MAKILLNDYYQQVSGTCIKSLVLKSKISKLLSYDYFTCGVINTSLVEGSVRKVVIKGI